VLHSYAALPASALRGWFRKKLYKLLLRGLPENGGVAEKVLGGEFSVYGKIIRIK
jgi:hypothetical protein